MITASEPSWIGPFTGLSSRQFRKLVTVLRRKEAGTVRRGRPWGLPLEDRLLLVAAYWRTNLTMRQLAPLFGVSKSAADRIINHLGPLLALQPRQRFAKDAVLIVDGTLVPTRDHTVAEQSKNYRRRGAGGAGQGRPAPFGRRSASQPRTWRGAATGSPSATQSLLLGGEQARHRTANRRGHPGPGKLPPRRIR